MFGFVTPEDRARWAARSTPEQREAQKRMFAHAAEGLVDSGQRIAEGRLQAEQTGRSVRREPQTRRTRRVTEQIVTEEAIDPDPEFYY
jgi:hypothetical protein